MDAEYGRDSTGLFGEPCGRPMSGSGGLIDGDDE